MRRRLAQCCASVLAVMGILFLGGCTTTPSDDSIATNLKAIFYSEPQLKNEVIDIAVSEGEVTLSGQVSSEAARYQAFKLANQAPGVEKVTDLLKVAPAEADSMAQVDPQPAPPSRPAPPPKKSKPAAQASPQAPVVQPVPVPQEKRVAPAVTTPPPPQPRYVTLPAGTTVTVRMIDSINSETGQRGAEYQASLDAPVVVGNEVIIPRGADAFVRLLDTRSAGKFRGRSELQVVLERLIVKGQSYQLESSIHEKLGEARGKETAKRVGIGAAVGTAIGAIAGGKKGAAIGAGVGAGGGTASQVITKDKPIEIASEAKIDFTLEQPLEILLQP